MSIESCIEMGKITANLYALGKDSIQVRQTDDVEDSTAGTKSWGKQCPGGTSHLDNKNQAEIREDRELAGIFGGGKRK